MPKWHTCECRLCHFGDVNDVHQKGRLASSNVGVAPLPLTSVSSAIAILHPKTSYYASTEKKYIWIYFVLRSTFRNFAKQI